jgi:hypothetical protein
MIQKLLQIVYSEDETNEIVKIFYLNLSLRYLKNDNLERRLNGSFELSKRSFVFGTSLLSAVQLFILLLVI